MCPLNRGARAAGTMLARMRFRSVGWIAKSTLFQEKGVLVKRTRSSISAAALAVALMAAPAFSQVLSDSAEAGLIRLGIDAPAETLSTGQVAQIENVLAGTDPDDIKRDRIEEIIGGSEATATGRLGVGQLRSSVTADLARIGVDTEGVDMLTLSQLAQIENVMNGDESDDVKKMRVEEIVGGEATATGRLGVAQLQDSVAADLARLGVDADMVDSLTLSQLGQIENVMNSNEPDDQKKDRINTIIAQ
jgi:hypothetical protein